MNIEHIPVEMRQVRRWVGRCADKTPINPRTLKGAQSTTPSTWGTLSEAVNCIGKMATYNKGETTAQIEGIGFVLGDGWAGADLDTVLDPVTGEIAPDALAIINELATYTERSPSGYGLHCIVRVDPVIKLAGHKFPLSQNSIVRTDSEGRQKCPELEMYTSGRYFTITGDIYGDKQTAEERADIMCAIAQRYADRKKKSEPVATTQNYTPVSLSDSELIDKIRKSRNADLFNRLWNGNIADFGDRSAADMSLCNILAFWTQKDAAQIDRLFRLSGLMRSKWDERHYSDGRTYGQATIATAIRDCTAVYEPRKDIMQHREPESESQSKNPEAKTDTMEWVYTDGKGNKRVDCPKLADHIRENLRYIFARDGARGSRDILVYKNGVYRLVSPEEFKGEIKRFVPREAYHPRVVNNVYEDIITTADDPHIMDIEKLNTDENIINFQNGLLHLDTMELHPHSPDILTTIQIASSYKPIEECTNNGTFDRFISHQLGGDAAQIRLQMEFLGVGISNVDASRMKMALFHDGPGNTGKSLMRSLGNYLVGAENSVPIDLQGIETRFGLATLYNKRLGGCSDMSFTKIDELANFKKLTGGDSVHAEFKGKQLFSFKYRGLLWFSMNELPQFGGDHGSWVYDRICVIRTVGETYSNDTPAFDGIVYRDPQLFEKLIAEKEYIVAKAIQALRGVIDRGYKYSVQPKNRAELDRYKVKNDPILGFIDECCIPRQGKGYDKCSRPVLWRVFLEWCKDNTKSSFQGTKHDFFDAIEAKGWGEIVTVNGTKYYKAFTITRECKEEYARVYGYDSAVGYNSSFVG